MIDNYDEEYASPLIGVSKNLSNLDEMVSDIDTEDLSQYIPRHSDPACEAGTNVSDISTGGLGVDATGKARERSAELTANSVITTADFDQDMCTMSQTCATEHFQKPR